MATVAVRCPQGIGRLIALGRSVARVRSWGIVPRVNEASIGLWLACVLKRAELRGRLEVTEDRVQAVAEPTPLAGDAALLDRAIALWPDVVAAQARTAGAQETDTATLTVQLPSDTGELVTTVVVVTGILASSAAAAWVAGKFLDWRRSAGANAEASDVLAEASEFALDVADRCQKEQRPCTPEERQAITGRLEAAAVVAKQMATQPKTDGLFGGLESSTLLIAALALGGVWFATRGRA